jgi:hypothetical protein
MSVSDRLTSIEKQLKKIQCCLIPLNSAQGGLAGLLYFKVGTEGSLTVFLPYTVTSQAYPAATALTYTNALLADYNIVIQLNGQGYLVEGTDYTRTTGDTIIDRNTNGARFEPGEIYVIQLYNK